MALLLVTIPLTPGSATAEYGWSAWSSDGSKLRSQGSAPPALLPASDEIILGVPSGMLSWHQVTLPQGSMSGAVRLRSVLNGLLEDRLLDDPESLHFALEPGARVGVPVWVALPFARLRSIQKNSDGKLDPDKVKALVFIVDKGAMPPGSKGTIWIDDLGVY